MDRVVVVGPPGAGKTTFAASLARTLGRVHVEMDALYWGPNWQKPEEDDFRTRLEAAAAGDEWVLDGNHFVYGAHEIACPRADTVVWLDQPRWVTVPRVARRTISQCVRRKQLWSGNRTSVRRALGRSSMIRYAWREHHVYTQHCRSLTQRADFGHIRWVRLQRPRDVRRWLSSIAAR